jgi:hypothetical protein
LLKEDKTHPQTQENDESDDDFDGTDDDQDV